MSQLSLGGEEYCNRALERLAAAAKDRPQVSNLSKWTIEQMKCPDLSAEAKANLYFQPLKVACESNDDALSSIAVDCAEKLLAHGLCTAAMQYAPPTVPEFKQKKRFFGTETITFTPVAATPGGSAHGLIGLIVETICANVNTPMEDTQRQIIRSLLTAVSTPSCAIHGTLLLVAIKAIFSIYLQARSKDSQNAAKLSLSQIIGIVQARSESDVNSEVQIEEEAEDERTISFSSQSEKDCFMIFRSLCSLSTKSIPEEHQADCAELRTKLLSLSLLQHFLASSTNLFSTNEVSFELLIRQKLCRSLLENSASPIIDVCRLSLKLLCHIVRSFRSRLRKEVAIFMYNVLFPMLDSRNTSFAQKTAVLEVIQALGDDVQLLPDIFVNYDCVVGATSLFEHFVLKVSKVVQTSHIASNWITPKQDEQLKTSAVEVLRTIIRAMSQWLDARVAEHSSTPDRSGVEEDDQGGFEKLMKNKKTMDTVIEAFNVKPKDGIHCAINLGLLKSDDPDDLAIFLQSPGLNKVKIGEYLAKADARPSLRSFICSHNFAGMVIDEAMRLFLGKFKIVGEAQIVDVTMETFAEHYCQQNPTAFSSAGTAYVLAFSIMMLNTDAHSIHIKEKMSLAEFVRNNRGIDDGKDLAPEFLESVYKRITTKEIKLQGQESPHGQQTSKEDKKREAEMDRLFLSLQRKKEIGYKAESNMLIQKSMNEIEASFTDEVLESYVVASSAEVARAMWQTVWTAVLAAFSVPMEEAEAVELIDNCLTGFVDAMHLNCQVSAPTEREAFIFSLTNFTHLTSLREIAYKNIKSIISLLEIASREGNGLESSWYDVLKCVSLLDKLQVLNSRDFAHKKLPQSEHEKVQHLNAEIIAYNIDPLLLEKLFAASGDLSGPAVVYLIESLCRVSAEELQEPTPRTYSLQKLVEVTEINIGRMRYVWSQMWVHLSRYFTAAGLSPLQNVALFSVDSLRQLAMKFLQRDELGNFNFQRDFLKPFDTIVTHSKQIQIRELVIASVGQMVYSRAANIMSGWRVVLHILMKASSDSSASVVKASFAIAEQLFRKFMYYFVSKESFCDLLTCVSSFCGATSDAQVAEAAMEYLELFPCFLSNGIPTSSHPMHDAPPETSLSDIRTLLTDSSDTVKVQCVDGDFRLWLSLFSALSSLVSSGATDIVRERALRQLFNVYAGSLDAFSFEQWQLLMGGTIQPIAENLLCDINLRNDEGESEKKLLRLAISQAAQLLRRHPVLRGLLDDFITLVFSCLKRCISLEEISSPIFDSLLEVLCSYDHPSAEWLMTAENFRIFASTIRVVSDRHVDISSCATLASLCKSLNVGEMSKLWNVSTIDQFIAAYEKLFMFVCSVDEIHPPDSVVGETVFLIVSGTITLLVAKQDLEKCSKTLSLMLKLSEGRAGILYEACARAMDWLFDIMICLEMELFCSYYVALLDVICHLIEHPHESLGAKVSAVVKRFGSLGKK